jgi:hypothetical protein
MGKKVLLATALVLLGCAAADAAYLTENFDSGVNDGWTMNNDSGGLVWPVYDSPSGVAGDKAWCSYDGLTTRASKSFGTTTDNELVLTFQFYAAEATTSSRCWGGLQNVGTNQAPVVDNAMIRLGTNNVGTYQVHYYDGGLKTINTGVATGPGWYNVELKWNESAATMSWKLNDASGSATYVNAMKRPNGVTLGYNYSNGTSGTPPDSTIWYDNISVTPEPAAMVLLAIGGLLFVPRRRRA